MIHFDLHAAESMTNAAPSVAIDEKLIDISSFEGCHLISG
jgi:hypothetical protein